MANKPTIDEKNAASRAKNIAKWNRRSVDLNLGWMNDLYDASDKQNKELLNDEKVQNRQKTEADRFQAQRSLQNAARGLVNTVGQGLNSSATGNIANMVRGQQDSDNVDYWTTLRQNQNTVENAYQEALNQNYLSRREAGIKAQIAKRDIESNLAASLQNIHPDLYEKPTSSGKYGSLSTQKDNTSDAKAKKSAADNKVRSSGYVSKAYDQPTANTNGTALNDYFSRLLRGI